MTGNRQQAFNKGLILMALAFHIAGHSQADEFDMLEITASTARVFKGRQVLGTVQQGEQFKVLDAKEPWYRIKLSVDSEELFGWVLEDSVRLYRKEPESRPPSSRRGEKQFLQISIERAPVYSGRKVLGHVYRGQIYEILAVDGRWSKIAFHSEGDVKKGFLLDTAFVVAHAADLAPSLAGYRPASVVLAKTRFAWKEKSVSIRADTQPIRTGAELQLAPPAGTVASAPLKFEQAEGRITAPGKSILDRVSIGTRSLWLIESSVGDTPLFHRIDLPPLRLETELRVHRNDNHLILSLPVKGLLPGFMVDFASDVGLQPAARLRTLTQQEGVVPRVNDVYHFNGDSREYVRLTIPATSDSQHARTYRIRIRNSDGALSQTIEVTRKGNTVNTRATIVGKSVSPLVDATTEVPAVELLPAEEAVLACQTSGLTGVLVDTDTLDRVKLADVGSQTVARQGVPEGKRVLRGSNLWLSVEADFVSNELGLAQPPPWSTPFVETNDDFGIVQITAGSSATPEVAIDENNLVGGLVHDALTDGRPTPAAILPLTAPGIAIDPHRSAQQTAEAMVLKAIVESVLSRPISRHLDSGVAQAVIRSVDKLDADLVARLKKGRELTAQQIQSAVSIVVEDLEIELEPGQRRQIVSAWQQRNALRRHPTHLDRNQNGRVADDVAIWLIHYLFSQGRYNPARHVSLSVDSGGNAVAVLGSWHGRQLLIDSPLAPSPTDHQRDEQLLQLSGEANVTLVDGPDIVRVPQVVSETVGIVHHRLRDIGLNISKPDHFFSSDKVRDSEPPESTWVPSGTAIDLDAQRRLPSVLKLSAKAAEVELRRWGFKGSERQKPPKSAKVVVVQQSPAAGRYADVGHSVELDLKTIVPHAVGKLQPAAVAYLQARGMIAHWTTIAFNSDKVVDQLPAAGTLVSSDSRILLTLHVRVPDVTGQPLAHAIDALERKDLQVHVPNRFARDNDRVRGQNPQNGYLPHQGTVSLGPVMGRIPNVVGLRVTGARTLAVDEGYEVETIDTVQGLVREADVVMRQYPKADRELERGQAVTIDVRVRTPNALRENIVIAQRMLARAKGNLRSFVIGRASETDFVHSQSPEPGQLIYPRTTVRLMPGVDVPDLTGLLHGNAVEALRRRSLRVGRESVREQETTIQQRFNRAFVEGQRPLPGLYRREDVNAIDLAITEYVPAWRRVPDIAAAGGDFVIQVGAAINVVKRSDLTPLISYRGRVFNEAEWAGLALRAAIQAPPEIARDLDRWEVRSIYDLRFRDQNPKPGVRRLAGSNLVIEVATTRR